MIKYVRVENVTMKPIVEHNVLITIPELSLVLVFLPQSRSVSYMFHVTVSCRALLCAEDVTSYMLHVLCPVGPAECRGLHIM